MVDIGNLLCTWEKCLIDLDASMTKLITHLEVGDSEIALIRALETKEALDKMQAHIQRMKAHCVGEVHTNVERKI